MLGVKLSETIHSMQRLWWVNWRRSYSSLNLLFEGTGEHITKFALARRLGEALARGSSEKEERGDPHGILEGLLREFWGESVEISYRDHEAHCQNRVGW
jgi:hypothetical protein